VIAREGDRSLSVLLLSDLDDSGFDTAPLTEELTTYERDGIRLRVIPLFPAPEDRKLFTGIAGQSVFVDRPELLRNTTVRERLTLVGSSPWMLVSVGAVLLGLLALNERWGARLTWGRGS
jgi:hypothetical protein